MGNPGTLGGAQGRISIDVTQLQAAQVAVQNASRQMTQALSAVGPAAQNAQQSSINLAGGLRQLAGAFGITLGAAGVVQFVRAAAAANDLATAYNRQRVAAENLAGGQSQLNQLLETYERAVGGSVSRVEALESVTKLLSVGFADSAEELEQFATAIRGISIAMGRSEDFVTQNLILELFSQRGQRLDQLGLQYDKVRQRAEALRAADRSLTQEMAYQQAVLEQANERFGTLTRRVEGQKTEVERLRDAWADFRLELAQDAREPVEETASALNDLLSLIEKVRERNKQLRQEATSRRAAEEGRLDPFGPAFSRTSIGRTIPQAFGGGASASPRFNADQTAAITEWWRGVQDIERQAARDRLDATRQFEQQRSDTIRQYEKTIAREAQDFALQRARAEQDYAISLQRMRRDIANREARQLADLERTIADARTDAAERAAERQVELNERIAETRSQSNERIAELEADFARRRERAQRDHADRLRDAAANLDAVAVREAQRDRRRANQEAQEDFDERVQKERANEAKRLEELNKAFAKQAADEARALQKRIDDANEAYREQLEDARAADAQRIEDMAADFQLRKEREEEDRGIRLERLRQDHEDQLAEQVRQHEARMIQIADQAQEERNTLDEEFQKEMDALNIRIGTYAARLKGYEIAATAAFDAVWGHMIGTMQGPQPLNPLITPGQFPSLNPVPVAPRSVTTNNARNIVIHPGAVVIQEATRVGQTKEEVWQALIELVDEG